MNKEKIAELKNYFKQSKNAYTIDNDYDFNLKAEIFSFCKNSKIKILKIPEETIDDFSTEKIIRKVEKAKWQSIIEKTNDKLILINDHLQKLE